MKKQILYIFCNANCSLKYTIQTCRKRQGKSVSLSVAPSFDSGSGRHARKIASPAWKLGCRTRERQFFGGCEKY